MSLSLASIKMRLRKPRQISNSFARSKRRTRESSKTGFTSMKNSLGLKFHGKLRCKQELTINVRESEETSETSQGNKQACKERSQRHRQRRPSWESSSCQVNCEYQAPTAHPEEVGPEPSAVYSR